MKLYIANGSTNCRKVQAVANHLGIAIETIYLDYKNGDLKSSAYLSINPTGKVPALADNDFTLWESNAINKYLCSKCAGNALYPDDPRMQADIDRWLSWELAHFNDQMGILAFQTVLKPNVFGEQPDEHLVTWSMRMLRSHADVLERHLEGRLTMVGAGLTIADYAIIHLESMKDMTPFDWSFYPNINAYFDRMRAVPYWANTAAKPDEFVRVPAGARAFAAWA
jgi:glutathione S-transferase